MYRYLLSLVFFGFFLFLIHPEQLKAYSAQMIPSKVACVKVFDAGRPSFDRQSIRFYNGCPDEVYMNVCVLDENNRTKLFTSPRRILTNGNYTITTLPGEMPRRVQWTVAPYNPPIPGLCAGTVPS